jgi:hypothetical protein
MNSARHPQCGTSQDIDRPFVAPVVVVVVLVLVLAGRLAGYPPSEVAAIITVVTSAWVLSTQRTRVLAA